MYSITFCVCLLWWPLDVRTECFFSIVYCYYRKSGYLRNLKCVKGCFHANCTLQSILQDTTVTPNWHVSSHLSALKHGVKHYLYMLAPDYRLTRLVSSIVHTKLATVSTLHVACSYFRVKIVRVISICLRDLVFRTHPDCWDQYLISGIKAPSSKPVCDTGVGVA